MQVSFYINHKFLQAWQQEKRYTVVHGGRGSGKSLQAGALALLYSLQNPGSRILCVRGTQNRISESSLQILKDVISMMQLDKYFIQTENTLKSVNDSEFLLYGGKSYQNFKSLQGVNLCWIDEATELVPTAWETLIPTIREDNSRFLISFNPEKETDWVYKNFLLTDRPDSAVVQMNYQDNPYFPKVLEAEMMLDKSQNRNKYLHIWEGELVKATEGALWKEVWFKYLPDDQVAKILLLDDQVDLSDIVVSIDPSTTNKATSDPCGLVVACKYKEDYLVLDDDTQIRSPQEWAKRAIELFDLYQANRIIYESNQGGQMVETIIKQYRPDILCRPVHASKSKITRAEPIASLYEAGKVYHLKRFPNLESELLTYTGDKKDSSPNSLDACVHAITYLLKKKVGLKGLVQADLSNFKF